MPNFGDVCEIIGGETGAWPSPCQPVVKDTSKPEGVTGKVLTRHEWERVTGLLRGNPSRVLGSVVERRSPKAKTGVRFI